MEYCHRISNRRRVRIRSPHLEQIQGLSNVHIHRFQNCLNCRLLQIKSFPSCNFCDCTHCLCYGRFPSSQKNAKLSYLNGISLQELESDFTFMERRSLQIHIIGILDFLMTLISWAIPPRSPADMPSTSSIMRTTFLELLTIE